jgi:hypothetical protein
MPINRFVTKITYYLFKMFAGDTSLRQMLSANELNRFVDDRLEKSG